MDKYIDFDIDSKKTVACVVQKGKKDRYAIFNRYYFSRSPKFQTNPTSQPEHIGPFTNHPENSPIFTRKSIQPIYNQKARYLQILQKYPFRKYPVNSTLQKSENLS